MSEISDWFRRKLKAQEKRLTFLYVPADHIIVEGQIQQNVEQSILPDEHYFRIWVKEMRLGSSTRWFTDLTPAVHSLASLSFADEKIDLATIAGPSAIEGVSSGNLNQAISLNHPLTTILPFVGGDVAVSLGLIAVPVSDGIGSFLKVVSDISGLLGAAQLSSVVSITQTAAKSVQEFLGVANPALQLLYQDTFTATDGGRKLKSGYILAVNTPDKALKPADVWVKDSRVYVGGTADASAPLDEVDYMLVHLQRIEQRDDWDEFSAINAHLNDAMLAALEGNREQALKKLSMARTAAFLLADLTRADRRRVIQAMRDRVYDQLDQGFEPLANISIMKSVTGTDQIRSPLASVMAVRSGDAASDKALDYPENSNIIEALASINSYGD